MPVQGKRSAAQRRRWRKVKEWKDPRDPKVACRHNLPSPDQVQPGSMFELIVSGMQPEMVRRDRPDEAPARRGTGRRHRVLTWPTGVTGLPHKLVIPEDRPGTKSVLVMGDSHLRAFVDRKVGMKPGNLSFGFMATPGGAADQLRAEMKHALLPRDPDLVVVLGPSNNLTASRTFQEAGAAFRRYLGDVCDRFPHVAVADVIPRLTVHEELQVLMRQEFHRVAASFGLKYWSFADHFPLDRLDLWARDGVHLSDDGGMLLLADLLWNHANQHLERLPASGQVSPGASSSASPGPLPEMEVRGNARSSRARRARGGDRKKTTQVEPVEEFAVPLNPVFFSRDILAAMDLAVPSALGEGAPVDIPAPSQGRPKKPGLLRRRRTRQQASSTPAISVPSGVKEAAAVDQTPTPPPGPVAPAPGPPADEVTPPAGATQTREKTPTCSEATPPAGPTGTQDQPASTSVSLDAMTPPVTDGDTPSASPAQKIPKLMTSPLSPLEFWSKNPLASPSPPDQMSKLIPASFLWGMDDSDSSDSYDSHFPSLKRDEMFAKIPTRKIWRKTSKSQPTPVPDVQRLSCDSPESHVQPQVQKAAEVQTKDINDTAAAPDSTIPQQPQASSDC